MNVNYSFSLAETEKIKTKATSVNWKTVYIVIAAVLTLTAAFFKSWDGIEARFFNSPPINYEVSINAPVINCKKEDLVIITTSTSVTYKCEVKNTLEVAELKTVKPNLEVSIN